MILLDIDNTIAFTNPSDAQITYWEASGGASKALAGFDEVWMPNYVVKALQGSEDVMILSTWGKFSQHLIDVFWTQGWNP